jgi:hypothetical protein
MEPLPEERDEGREYAKWARSEERFWGKMQRRDGIWLLAMIVFFILWLVFDFPKHGIFFQ